MSNDRFGDVSVAQLGSGASIDYFNKYILLYRELFLLFSIISYLKVNVIIQRSVTLIVYPREHKTNE